MCIPLIECHRFLCTSGPDPGGGERDFQRSVTVDWGDLLCPDYRFFTVFWLGCEKTSAHYFHSRLPNSRNNM
jgi:hypothetical protein